MKTSTAITLAAGMFAAMHAGSALASAQTFTGQNAAIFATANPGGNAALMASVNRPVDKRQAAAAAAGRLDPAQIVQQSILGQISAKINDNIFNGGQNSGNFDLGNGNQISYVRDGSNLIITIIDTVHGRTVITLPNI